MSGFRTELAMETKPLCKSLQEKALPEIIHLLTKVEWSLFLVGSDYFEPPRKSRLPWLEARGRRGIGWHYHRRCGGTVARMAV